MISRVLNFLRRGKQRLIFESRPHHYKVIRDIDYLTPASIEKADLYLPKNSSDKPRPGIVVIHGGGWVEGDKKNLRELSICADLANGGFVVLCINYVLFRDGDPHTLWPRNLHQCKTAVRWLRKNGSRYQIDTDQIGVLGESAGAHLAAMVALTGPTDGLDPAEPYAEYSCRVQAGVVLYGLYDFRRRNKILPILGRLPAEAPDLYAKASPAAYGDKSDPPLLIIHGTNDKGVSVDQSKNFAESLKRNGAPHELLLVPEAGHAFDLQPDEMDLRPAVLGFFEKHLSKIRIES